jgi:GntR family transcriptional regulator
MYIKVAETLKSRIHNCTYRPGDRIPAARELAQEFAVSSITIRKAVEQLTRQGFLQSRQGAGTMVILPETKKMEIQISGNFRDWLDSASGRSSQLEIEILDIGLFQPPQNIRAVLGVGRHEAVGRLRRLRRCRGQIVSYFINYFSKEHLQRLPREKLAKRSFIEVFQESTCARLKCLEQRVEAVIAEMDLAEVLETRFGSPLFFVENVYHSNQDKPFIVTHMYYRGDRYVYRAFIPLNENESVSQHLCAEAQKRVARPETCHADDHQ